MGDPGLEIQPKVDGRNLMTTQSDWKIAEPDMAAILDRHSRPLEELAAGKTPAIVLRSAYPEQACRQLIERLTQDELIYDPRQPTPEEFRAQSIPEGYFKKGSQSAAAWASRATGTADRTRIDIGTSLGYRGDDQEAFLQHSQETHTLFERLFCGSLNPVEILYDSLQQLSVNKKAVTAYEPDGRRYGPAIIRAHYGAILTGSPHLALLPGAAIMCLVLAFNALSGAMARHTFDTGHEH